MPNKMIGFNPEDSEIQKLGESGQISQHPVPASGEKIEIERGKFSKLTIYEVAEHELVLIERGGDSSLWLNFAIACISIFFSILAALVTLEYENHPKVFIVFVVVTVVTALGTIICGALWWRNRNAQQEIFKTIRGRMK